MSQVFVITGTDTDIGKTIFAAALTAALEAHYWKPVQAGLDDETDSEAVTRLAALSPERLLPERYRLKTPASPHFAAAQEGIAIEPEQLAIPDIDRPLVVEGAGGALVPMVDETLYADLFAQWQQPVIIVASTRLGTINHSLLTIESLRQRAVPIHGIAFIGEEIADTQETICRIGNVRMLGRLPWLEQLTPASLLAAFHDNFNLSDFQ